MKKYKEMNGNEKIAYKNTKYAFRFEVGGIENEVLDGHREEMPTYEELEELVYEATTTATYGEGSVSCRPTKEVTFAGEQFIREVIRHFLDTESQFELKHEQPAEAVVEEPKSEDPKPAVVEKGDKSYFSVVRCKTNIKAQPFILMRILANNKKHAEDIMFSNNFAPFGNKVMTEEQIMSADVEWLNKVGIQSKEELAQLIQNIKEGKVTK